MATYLHEYASCWAGVIIPVIRKSTSTPSTLTWGTSYSKGYLQEYRSPRGSWYNCQEPRMQLMQVKSLINCNYQIDLPLGSSLPYAKPLRELYHCVSRNIWNYSSFLPVGNSLEKDNWMSELLVLCYSIINYMTLDSPLNPSGPAFCHL